MPGKVKDTRKKSFENDSARFRELVVWWADRLGRQHIPLREHTDNINDFLAPDAVHHELIQRVVRAVYRANNCGHLDAVVSLENTFTALGHVRVGLADSTRADIDQINLLDNLGWHTNQYFGFKPGATESAKATVKFTSAQVRTLSRSAP